MYTQLKLLKSNGNCFCKFLVPCFEERCYVSAFPLARQLANHEGLIDSNAHIDGERPDSHSKMPGDKPSGPGYL